MRIIQHPEAAAELIEAGRFYEQKVPSLGAQFLAAVDEAVALIAAAPQRWPVGDGDVRRYLMPRFPYAIYYRAVTGEIRVLAFQHHSRHPDYWRHRVSR
jgi:plasmid stabilization system protein ParE